MRLQARTEGGRRGAPGPDPGCGGTAADELRAAIEASQELLFARALRLTRNHADAHDLVQDTVERGLRAADRLAPDSNVMAWLLRVMTNRFLDQCRSQARLVPLPDDAEEAAQLAPEPDPAAPAWAQITPEQVQAALLELDPLFREAYELRIKAALSYDEIAARLQVPPGTVATRLARARSKLRAILNRTFGLDEEETR